MPSPGSLYLGYDLGYISAIPVQLPHVVARVSVVKAEVAREREAHAEAVRLFAARGVKRRCSQREREAHAEAVRLPRGRHARRALGELDEEV